MDVRQSSESSQPHASDNSGNLPGSPFDDARLFGLPEYEWAFFRFVKTAVDSLVFAKNPVLSKMRAIPSSEFHTSRNTTDSGDVVDNKPIRMALEIAIDIRDVVVGNLAAVTETVNNAAEEGVATIVPQVSEYMVRVVDAFGTAVNLNGAPFDHTAIRKIVEANPIEFDEDGRPDLESWIFATRGLQRAVSLEEMIRQLPPRTQEEMRGWDEMIGRKRDEFNASRRRRTLS